VASKGVSDGVGSFSGESDSLGHVVWQRSLAEDGKAEEVDLGLSDAAPSHGFTSAAMMRLDIRLVKV